MIEGESFEDLRRRAENGSAFDQEQMGAFLATGVDGVCEKNETEARYWYLRAARQGYLDAKYNLAIMLLEGAGGRKDVGKAMLLMEQAAAEQCYNACRFLSSAYESGGYGKQVDANLSRQWWQEYERLMALDICDLPDFGAALPEIELPD